MSVNIEHTCVTRLHSHSHNTSKTQPKYKFYSVYQNGKAFKFHIQSKKSGVWCARSNESEILSPINIQYMVYYLSHIGFEHLTKYLLLHLLSQILRSCEGGPSIVTPFIGKKWIGKLPAYIDRSIFIKITNSEYAHRIVCFVFIFTTSRNRQKLPTKPSTLRDGAMLLNC